MFAKAGVQKFLGAFHPVQVEVVQLDRRAGQRQRVRFAQRIGRALHVPGVAGGVHQRACQRGLACTEIAMQIDRQAGGERTSQRRAQGDGAGFFMQQKIQVSAHRIEWIFPQTELCDKIPDMTSAIDYPALAQAIKAWGRALGFAEIRITPAQLPDAEAGLQAWLDEGRHGDMAYMAAHGMLRARPAELVPGTQRVIVARMDYLPQGTGEDWREREWARHQAPTAATVSLYARGRDYHRVLRARLQQLADRISAQIGGFSYRVFTDSAPLLEVALAAQAGLGWRGKHTLLLQRDGGSMFFLGEMLVDLPLPVDAEEAPHCGRCRACLDACPTQAITAPYRLDARRCISYLTIEHAGSIPEALRPLLGNRIYGCDDCQLICPWNKFAQSAVLPDFDVRNGLDRASLLELFGWSEDDFNRRLEGSPIRRIGHERWLRNIAVALGNSVGQGPAAQVAAIRAALAARNTHPSALVREHVAWALARLPA